MTLNRRQNRFAQEYLIDLNATQAAIRAGYSPRTAYSTGQRLLNHVEVIAKVSRLIEARAVRTEVSAERVVMELARVAFGDIRSIVQVVEEEGDHGPVSRVVVKPSAEWTRDEAATVAEVAQTRQGIRVKTHPKLQALEALAKHLGMYVTRVDLNLEASLTLGDPASMTDDELRQALEE